MCNKKQKLKEQLIYIKKNFEPEIWNLIKSGFTDDEFCSEAYGISSGKCTENCSEHIVNSLAALDVEINDNKLTDIKVATLIQTCSACPSQWDLITESGKEFYIRYRWGNLSVSMRDHGDYNLIYSRRHGDSCDGLMSSSELIKILSTKNFFDFTNAEIKRGDDE